MKKLLAVLAPFALALTACAITDGTTATGQTSAATGAQQLAMAAVKVGVQAKCVTEVENNSYWQTASQLLTQTQKQELQTEVCSCVAKKPPPQ